jgi:hypothetical protein
MENMSVRVAGGMDEVRAKDPALVREWDSAIGKENAKDGQLR